MAFDIPSDQIRELQISLRKEAGLQSYDPNDSQLPDFPSFEDAISQLDPSPEYLRCKNCKASLIRGINSVFCIFCGAPRNKDVPPDPIKFTSTSGYRWFLHSLDLDGSELVGPSIEESQSKKGPNTPETELPLSDLLDLEIRWLSEPKSSETSNSERGKAQKLSSQNVAGVDLDSFFVEAKAGHASESTSIQFSTDKHEDGNGRNTFQGHGGLSLFENAKPSEADTRTVEDIRGDSFSGWEADFQSAGSGTHTQEQKFPDPSIGSSSVDLSSHMDAVFGSGKNLFDEEGEGNFSSTSNTDDWFEGPWSSSKPEIATRDALFEVPQINKNQEAVGKANDSSSTSADWFQGNQWQSVNNGSAAIDNRNIDEGDDDWDDFTSSTNTKVPSSDSNPIVVSQNVDWIQSNQCQTTTGSSGETDNRAVDDDDPFDAWNDFTSSTSAKALSTDSFKDVNHRVPSLEQASDINLLGGSSNSKDADFGSVSQLDFFSTALSNQANSTETNSSVAESFVPDKTNSKDGSGGISQGVDISGNILNGVAVSETTSIDGLMSQMHDLSFMLESNLSLPQKKNPENVDAVSSLSKD